MKKNLIIVLLILLVPVFSYMLLTKTTATVVQTDTTEVLGKPQVLKFTSSMCLDCQKMSKIFTEIFPKYQNTIILTEIPVQDGSSFTNSQIEKYNVNLVPTIILIDSEGKVVKRIEGAIEKSEMDNYLKGLK